MRLLPFAIFATSVAALALSRKNPGRKTFGDEPNPDLDQAFDVFNRKYFAGQLPKVPCVFAADLRNEFGGNMIGHLRWEPPDNFIEISTVLTGASALIKMTLLHEMAHLKLNVFDGKREEKRKSHGPVFEKEMRRLAAAGAFKGLW